MITTPMSSRVVVCPRPHDTPTQKDLSGLRYSLTMVDTATTWSGSNECFSPSTIPSAQRGDQTQLGKLVFHLSSGPAICVLCNPILLRPVAITIIASCHRWSRPTMSVATVRICRLFRCQPPIYLKTGVEYPVATASRQVKDSRRK